MRRSRWVLPAAGIVISVFLLYSAYWLHLIRQADAAFQQGHEMGRALEQYQNAVARTPPLVGLLPGLREPLRHSLLKQAQILHLQQKRDEALVHFQELPTRYAFLEKDPEYHLWYGNALFVRGIFQEDPQALANDLQGALREYQTALQLDPTSWDARFNFELIKQALISEGEAGQLRLQLLLEEQRREDRRDNDLPPEKVG